MKYDITHLHFRHFGISVHLTKKSYAQSNTLHRVVVAVEGQCCGPPTPICFGAATCLAMSFTHCTAIDFVIVLIRSIHGIGPQGSIVISCPPHGLVRQFFSSSPLFQRCAQRLSVFTTTQLTITYFLCKALLGQNYLSRTLSIVSLTVAFSTTSFKHRFYGDLHF